MSSDYKKETDASFASNSDNSTQCDSSRSSKALAGSLGVCIASVPSHATMESYIRSQLSRNFSLLDSQMWLKGAQPPSAKYVPKGVFQEISKAGIVSPAIYTISENLTEQAKTPALYPFLTGFIAAGVRLPIDTTKKSSSGQVAIANFLKYTFLTGSSKALKSLNPNKSDSTSSSILADFAVSIAAAMVAKIGDDALVQAKNGKDVSSLFDKGVNSYFNGAYKKGFVPKTLSTAIAFFGFNAGQAFLATPIEGMFYKLDEGNSRGNLDYKPSLEYNPYLNNFPGNYAYVGYYSKSMTIKPSVLSAYNYFGKSSGSQSISR